MKTNEVPESARLSAAARAANWNLKKPDPETVDLLRGLARRSRRRRQAA